MHDKLYKFLFGDQPPIIVGTTYKELLTKTIPDHQSFKIDPMHTTRGITDSYSDDSFDALFHAFRAFGLAKQSTPQFKFVVNEWAIPSKCIQKQCRFSKSKKSRIRRKWSKDKSNYKSVEVDSILVDKVNFVIYGKKTVIDKIKKSLEHGILRRRQFWKHFQNRIDSASPGINVEPFGISSWSPMAAHSV